MMFTTKKYKGGLSMEFGNLLLDRLGFNREMLDAKLSEIYTKEKEIRVLKKEVSGIMEHISKLESTLNHGKHYYCGICIYHNYKYNKCVETGEHKEYYCEACEKFRDLPF